jgi:hypothetical protein
MLSTHKLCIAYLANVCLYYQVMSPSTALQEVFSTLCSVFSLLKLSYLSPTLTDLLTTLTTYSYSNLQPLQVSHLITYVASLHN